VWFLFPSSTVLDLGECAFCWFSVLVCGACARWRIFINDSRAACSWFCGVTSRVKSWILITKICCSKFPSTRFALDFFSVTSFVAQILFRLAPSERVAHLVFQFFGLTQSCSGFLPLLFTYFNLIYIFRFPFTYFGFPAPFRYFSFLFTYFGFLFTYFVLEFSYFGSFARNFVLGAAISVFFAVDAPVQSPFRFSLDLSRLFSFCSDFSAVVIPFTCLPQSALICTLVLQYTGGQTHIVFSCWRVEHLGGCWCPFVLHCCDQFSLEGVSLSTISTGVRSSTALLQLDFRFGF
jgi:hypothetical protein